MFSSQVVSLSEWQSAFRGFTVGDAASESYDDRHSSSASHPETNLELNLSNSLPAESVSSPFRELDSSLFDAFAIVFAKETLLVMGLLGNRRFF
mmetsp:Transcript_11274/g.13939  ORF Transcript_11274/g.13939 Transcript_11274/m.13939 type:complete len:94 (-) Transcript_11274:328-609(-)